MGKQFSTSCLLLAAAGITSAIPLATSNSSSFQIQWTDCASDTAPSLECGRMDVPLNWANPDGSKITIGMNRVPARDQENRIGTLFFNPGGPGVPATSECELSAAGISPSISNALLDHFDLFCLDPRGVGVSGSVQCDATLYAQQPSYYPQNETAFEALVASNKMLGASCLNMTGPLLQYIDTASVARDMEALRMALGDEPMNYLGTSYGTMLGATYAELFPTKIRTMALDGTFDHSVSPVEAVYLESSTYTNTLQAFFAWCTANSTACGFESTNMSQSFEDLVNRANQSPIPAPGCVADADTLSAGACKEFVTGDDIRSNAQGFLYFQYGLAYAPTVSWPGLGNALNQSIVSNNATLLSTALPSSTDGSFAQNTFAQIAISCLDWMASDAPLNDTAKAFNRLYEKQVMGSIYNGVIGSASGSYTNQAACLGWPVPPSNPQHELDPVAMAQAPPILMVHSMHDPACSYTMALNVQDQIPSAVLLTRNGVGHTSYFLRGEASVHTDSYLVNKTLPAYGTVVQS